MSRRRYRTNARSLGAHMSADELLDFAQDPTVSSQQLSMLAVGMLTTLPAGFHDKSVGGVHFSSREVREIVESCVLNPSADVEVWESIAINCEHRADSRDMLALCVRSLGFPMALMVGMSNDYLRKVARSVVGVKLATRRDFEHWFDEKMRPWDRRSSMPRGIDIVYAYLYDKDVANLFDETERSVIRLFMESTGDQWKSWVA